MKTVFPYPKVLCAIAGVAFLGAVAPVHAEMVEEVIVEGHQGKLPESVKRASTAVSYADLDLSTREGREELRHRVSLTARYLCEKLGETDTSSGVVPSCRDAAVRDTMRRVGTIEANAVPRGSAWVQPPPWAAPYPAAWVEESTTTRTYPAQPYPPPPPPPPAQGYDTYQAPPPQPQPHPTQGEPYYEY